MATQAQVDANRRNSLRSTGPRTEEGKAASRGNATRHGLAGEGVVILAEEAGEVERRTSALLQQLKPRNEMSQMLVRRAAVLSVRVERCADQELVAIALRGQEAEAGFAEHCVARAEEAFASLEESPRIAVRKLLRTVAGVARLLEAYRALQADLTDGTWTDAHGLHLTHLLGFRDSDCHAEGYRDLTAAYHGLVEPRPGARSGQVRPEDRRDWALGELASIIELEVEALVAMAGSFDPEEVEGDRRAFVASAQIDPTPAMLQARRYEAAAERLMYRALQEARLADAAPSLVEQAEQRGLEVAPATPDVDADSDKLASFPQKTVAGPIVRDGGQVPPGLRMMGPDVGVDAPGSGQGGMVLEEAMIRV